jgi:hypothetical protein
MFDMLTRLNSSCLRTSELNVMKPLSIRKLILTLIAAPALLLTVISAQGGDKRSKVIDFEDEVVEGVNKRPLDSLSQISEKDKKRRKPHLYRKRAGFRAETREVVRELRYVQ